jgi:DNA-binding NtrC family response regulator/tetratricopeptide (TPR) repeat protein
MSALQALLGTSPAITSLRRHVERLLPKLAPGRKAPPILLEGETGTGKGRLARAIHAASPRATSPFVEVTCSAIPETLLEAELFGFERGAFTDARQAKAGLLQSADGGTIFLDEIGLLPAALQGKLLGVLESRSVRRLGGTRSEPIDVLIVTATNVDLIEATRAGAFREDLYHRLAVLTFTLPPLRERGADIIELATDFLARACADYALPAKTLRDDARAALLAHAWPGNVRELANLMERVTLRSDDTTIGAHHLALPRGEAGDGPVPDSAGGGLKSSLERLERATVLEALQAAGGNVSLAAHRLGLPRSTLRHHLAKLGLSTCAGTVAFQSRAVQSPPPQRQARPTRPISDATIRWERRHVALLYATLSDTSPAPAIRQLDFISQKVSTFGGRVEDVTTSGLLATFGSDGVDDGPGRASDAALAMCRTLLRKPGDDVHGASKLRIAIDVTPVLVAVVSGEVRIDVAAKRDAASVLEMLATRSEPGAITLTDSALPFLSRRYRIEAASTSGSRTHRLIGPELMGTRGRWLTPFVGREREMTKLASVLARLSDCAQVVAITGDAGIGKSRLLYEFREVLRGKDFTCLEGRCTSAGVDVPHSVMISLLRNACGIADSDGEDAVADAVDRHLAQLALDPREIAPYLLAVLGVREPSDALGPNARAIQARTFDMLRRWLLNLARVRPAVVMLEDVHWIDRTSEACVVSLVRGLPGAPILFVSTSRPEHRPRWLDGLRITDLTLAPLPREESLSVVQAVLGAPAAEPVMQHILMRANGNPFFLEELSRDARERPVAVPDAVPGSIQQVLQERLDRLGDDARRLLEIGSVLGYEVPVDLLEVVSQRAAHVVEPTLTELTGLGFLHERRTGGRTVHVFHHELTRLAVYESLPPVRREALHLAAARAIETLWASRLSEVYDRLAHHYAGAGEAAKAVEYLTGFAEKAAQRYARAEAVTALHEALSQVERVPAGQEQDRLFRELVRRQRDALYSLLNLRRDTLEFLLRQEPLVERMKDASVAAHYHLWLSRVCAPLGEYELSVRSAERAIADARRTGDELLAACAAGVLANALAWLGRATEGARSARSAVQALAGSSEPYWLGYAYRGLALNGVLLGDFTAVRDAARHLDALGETLGEPFFQFSAAWIPGLALVSEGNVEDAIARFGQLIETAPGPLELAQATSLLAIAHLENRQPDQAIRLLEPLVSQAERLRQRHIRGVCTTYLGEAHRLKGDLDRARALAHDSLELIAGTGYRYGDAAAHRLLGHIALDAGQLAESESELDGARERFASIPVPHEHAQTHVLLAKLAERRGDRPRAQRHLESAVELWTEIGIHRHADRAREALTALGRG